MLGGGGGGSFGRCVCVCRDACEIVPEIAGATILVAYVVRSSQDLVGTGSHCY